MNISSITIESKIEHLQARLKAENESRDHIDIQPFDNSRSGSGRRPNNLGESTPSRTRKNLDLNFIQQPNSRIGPETENKLKKIMKRSGILNIDGREYQTDIKDLEDLGELGNGTSGHVVKMRHIPSGTIIAVKQMRRTGNDEENKRIIMDLDVVLKSHDCPYIVQCLGCFITQADVWICMELMATCFDKLQKKSNLPVPEDILGKVTVATVKALSYLKEKHGVIHRDVKPSNILIDEKGVIKLCDFGISGRLVDSKAKTRSAGCAAYMAPERIDPKKPEYDIRADVWSLGITLVELATGSFPYKGCKTDFEVLTKVLESDPPSLPTDQGFSLEFQDFVRKCLTKNSHGRPKYPELLRQPFLKYYETHDVDVPKWFSSVMEIAGLKSNRRLSPSLLQSEAHRTIATNIPNYQHSSSNYQPSIKPSSSSLITAPTLSSASASASALTSSTIAASALATGHRHIAEQHNGSNSIASNEHFVKNNLKYVNSGDKISIKNTKDDNNQDIVSEMNKMYRKSPFMQRRKEVSGDYGNASPRRESMLSNLGHSIIRNMTHSPFTQRKIINQQQLQQQQQQQHQQQQQQQQEGFWNLPQPNQHPPDGGGGDGGGVLGNINNISGSPLPLRKPLPSNIDNAHIRLQGNTSPIVLQRFYHQQSQLREKLEEEKLQQENTNPFLSHIPKYQTLHHTNLQSATSASNPIPIPVTSYKDHQQLLQHNHQQQSQQQQQQYHYYSPHHSPRTSQLSSSSNYTNSTINYEPNNYANQQSNIPVLQNQLNSSPKHHQYLFSNFNNKKNTIQPANIYADRGGGTGTGYGTQNVYSNNLYGRTLTNKSGNSSSAGFSGEMDNSSGNIVNGSGDTIKDDQGWFNSIAGVVKRRFASYVKLHLAAGDRDKEKERLEKERRLAAGSSVLLTNSTNPFINERTPSMIQPPSPHVLSGIDRRHRSPDPPPRYNRGQSPLMFRRNLLDLGQNTTGSPVLPRRYLSSSPPLPPPRRGSESVPGSPQHFRTRIHYTPEPQRRVYRPIDQ